MVVADKVLELILEQRMRTAHIEDIIMLKEAKDNGELPVYIDGDWIDAEYKRMTDYKELEEFENWLNWARKLSERDYSPRDVDIVLDLDPYELSGDDDIKATIPNLASIQKAIKQVEQRAREEIIESIINNGYATADKNYVSFDIRELKKLKNKQEEQDDV